LGAISAFAFRHRETKCWKAKEVKVISDSWRKSDHPQFGEGEKYRVSTEPMDSISRTALLSAKTGNVEMGTCE
jgi:hypothetical protein